MTLTITVRLRRPPHAVAAASRDRAALPGSAAGHGYAVEHGSAVEHNSAVEHRHAVERLPRGTLLALAEPAAMLIAEAAGLGLPGKLLLATALRATRHAAAA